MEEDEELLQLAGGRYQGKQGLVVATDRRVMFVEQGMMRSNLEDFPYGRISSVQTNKGMIFSEITIFASGNKAHVDQIAPKETGAVLGDLIRANLREPSGSGVTNSAPAADSALDKLKKLGELRDSGVISDQEFEHQKQRLMGEL
ncbi:MAG: PH domain-containing protein [Actinomycetota bacterium]